MKIYLKNFKINIQDTLRLVKLGQHQKLNRKEIFEFLLKQDNELFEKMIEHSTENLMSSYIPTIKNIENIIRSQVHL